jgi:hypothetical protein
MKILIINNQTSFLKKLKFWLRGHEIKVISFKKVKLRELLEKNVFETNDLDNTQESLRKVWLKNG